MLYNLQWNNSLHEIKLANIGQRSIFNNHQNLCSFRSWTCIEMLKKANSSTVNQEHWLILTWVYQREYTLTSNVTTNIATILNWWRLPRLVSKTFWQHISEQAVDVLMNLWAQFLHITWLNYCRKNDDSTPCTIDNVIVAQINVLSIDVNIFTRI